MQDLSANMFYKAKFTITANDQSVDLLWTLILEIRNWLLTVPARTVPAPFVLRAYNSALMLQGLVHRLFDLRQTTRRAIQGNIL